MKIVIITDSYGGPRIHKKVVDVDNADTYPELVKNAILARFPAAEVIVDYASFRKITDLPALLPRYADADITVIQAGIVDVFPRPLNQAMTQSKGFFASSLRKFIRKRRHFFIRHIYSRPWSTDAEILAAIGQVMSNVKRTVWINVAPVNAFQDAETPGANAAILRFNNMLSVELKNHPHCTELDIYSRLCAETGYEQYLHPTDSHLNKAGNRYYAETLMPVLLSMMPAETPKTE